MFYFPQLNYIFFILSLLFTINATPIFEIPIHFGGNRMYIFFENYSNSVALSFSHAYSYLSSSYFKEKYNDTNSYPLSQGTNEYFPEYQLFYDEFIFKDNQTPFKMYFYAINQKSQSPMIQHFRDYITFRFNQTRNNLSIVTQMYEQKVIERAQFGISYLNKKLYFGGIPNQNNLNKVLHQELNVTLLDQVGWYTDLSYIIIGNKKFDFINKDFIVLLNLGGTELSKATLIPNDTMNYLKKEYFIPYNKENNCYNQIVTISKINHYLDAGERYFCKREIIEKFPPFVFGLNKQKIVFRGKELFNCEQNITKDNYCLFEIHEQDKKFTSFSLGMFFFKHLSILFDYNVPQVELFEEFGYKSFTYSNVVQIQKNILIINIIFLIFMCIFIIGIFSFEFK